MLVTLSGSYPQAEESGHNGPSFFVDNFDFLDFVKEYLV